MSDDPQTSPRPGLFAYKTDPRHAGAVALDWFDPDPDAAEMSAELWTGFWAPGWSHVASLTGADGRPALVQYDRKSGAMGIATARVDGSGTDQVLSRPADPRAAGADLLIALKSKPATAARVLAYDATAGAGRLLTVGPEIGLGMPFPAPAGLDHLTPICEALVGYAARDGRALLLELRGDDNLETVWQENWEPGWDLQAAPTAPGQGLFSYRAGDGAWALRRIASAGSDTLAQGTWRPGWSVLVPFSMRGQAHLLGYEAASGDVEILRFPDAGAPGQTTVVWRFRWSAGWDIQVPLTWEEEVS